MPVQTEDIPESDKEKLEDISQQIKIDGETINMQLIERLAAKLGTSNDEVVLQLQKEGNQIPQEVLDETIEAGSKKEQGTPEPEGESFYEDLVDILVDKDPIPEDSLLTIAQNLIGLLFAKKEYQDVFDKGDYDDIFEASNIEAIKRIDKKEIVSVDGEGSQITRQGMLENITYTHTKQLITDDNLTQEKLDDIKRNNEQLGVNGDDIAKIKAEKFKGKNITLTVNDAFDEQFSEDIRNVQSSKDIKDLQKQAKAYDETTQNASNSRAVLQSSMMSEIKLLNKIKKLGAQEKQNIEENIDNKLAEQTTIPQQDKPSTSCSATEFEKATGEKSFAADVMKKQGIERDRGGNGAAAAA